MIDIAVAQSPHKLGRSHIFVVRSFFRTPPFRYAWAEPAGCRPACNYELLTISFYLRRLALFRSLSSVPDSVFYSLLCLRLPTTYCKYLVSI